MDTKKAIAVILAALLFFLFLSCADGAKGDRPGGEADDKSPGGETGEEAKMGFDLLPAEDYGGAEFVIGNIEGWAWVDLTLEVEAEDAGEMISDAIYRRNRIVEDKYNVSLKVIEIPYDQMVGKVRNQMMAGDCEYDLMQMAMQYTVAPLSVEGYIADANKLEKLDLTHPWWDDFAHACSSILGKQFFLFGDFTIADKEYANVVFFNKELQQRYGLPDFYQFVYDGSWTIDKMNEMMKVATVKLDASDKWTKKDQYGLVLNIHSKMGLFYGAGENLMKKDANDVPYWVVDSESFINAFNKMCEFLSSEHVGDAMGKLGSHQDEMFADGKGLFDATLLAAIRAPQGAQKGMEYDFGILPSPKLNDAQERYYTFMDASTPCISILNNDQGRLDRACTVLEALNAKSSEEVQPKYKEYALPNKYFRDEQSFEMLDIVLASRLFDMGVIYGWGNLDGNGGLLRNLLYNNQAAKLASTLESNLPKAVAAMEKDLALLSNLP